MSQKLALNGEGQCLRLHMAAATLLPVTLGKRLSCMKGTCHFRLDKSSITRERGRWAGRVDGQTEESFAALLGRFSALEIQNVLPITLLQSYTDLRLKHGDLFLSLQREEIFISALVLRSMLFFHRRLQIWIIFLEGPERNLLLANPLLG